MIEKIKYNNLINLKLIILTFRSNYIYIYSVSKLYKLFIVVNFSSVDSVYNKLTYNKKLLSSCKNCTLIKMLVIKWKRIVFKGKGFRVRVYRGSGKLILNFGHSHWTKIKFKNVWNFYKLKRQNYLFFSCIELNFTQFCKNILVRRLNVYTQRGLRLKKQHVRRRFGKISQYISSLH